MFRFILNSIMLGVGLAMDAFSVSIVNGINEPNMPAGRISRIAGTYAGFQFAMPMIGWVCVHTILEYFEAFQKFIPWIALLLLLYIGGKMLIEGLSKKDDEEQETEAAAVLSTGTLVVQGIATSIDALSVGFTIANYKAASAFSCAMLIAITTFIICFVGLHFGKKLGERFADRATVLGGVILILIGIEIFVTGI